jgi:GAF domain-containing protein
MSNVIQRAFTPPVFAENKEKGSAARTTHYTLWASLLVNLLGLASSVVIANQASQIINIMVNLVLAAFWVVFLYLLRLGYLRQVNILTIGVYLMAVNLLAFLNGGLSSPYIYVNFIVIAIATMLASRQVFWVSLLTAGAVWGLAFLERSGVIVADGNQRMTQPTIVMLLVCGIILHITSNKLASSLKTSFQSEHLLAQKENEFQAFKKNSDSQLAQRVRELESAVLQNEIRTNQLRAVAQVARSITSIQDVEQLLMQISRVISDEFGFYHVGIFIVDPTEEYAELRAASSSGGERMLARNHRLKVGVEGIVGTVAAIGRARIALDVGNDAIYFNNPDLPDTHSEIALPLIVSGKTIGVLDMQSDQPGAFSADDVDTLGTMANQIAVAIENARLLNQTRLSQAEAQRANQEFIRTEWGGFASGLQKSGYKFNGLSSEPIRESLAIPEIEDAGRSGQSHKSPQTLAIPVKLRGQTIGVIGLRTKFGGHEWTRDEVNIAQAAAERVALALENARLIEDSQKRAVIEKMTSDISSKIGSSVRFETILRTAAEEISRALDGSEVLVQLRASDAGRSDLEGTRNA